MQLSGENQDAQFSVNQYTDIFRHKTSARHLCNLAQVTGTCSLYSSSDRMHVLHPIRTHPQQLID